MNTIIVRYKTPHGIETLEVPDIGDVWTCIKDYDIRHETDYIDKITPWTILDVLSCMKGVKA